jgi:hypothetical protein
MKALRQEQEAVPESPDERQAQQRAGRPDLWAA